MRLAFIDLVFSWPPLGGAPLDLYYTMAGLQELGHEVHLFYGAEVENWWLEPVHEDELPFQATKLPFTRAESTTEVMGARFRKAVDAWKPDVVFQCFGFFMKPIVSLALSHYPQIARYYAYEPFCPRDYRLFWGKDTCTNNYLRTPNGCRRCTLKSLKSTMRCGYVAGYALEYEQAQAWSPKYYAEMVASLRGYKAIIVYNHFTKGLLEGFNDHVHVIGGGVHLEEFDHCPLPKRGREGRTVIFMSGRANDPTKGLKTLIDAGKILWHERQDFEIWATLPETPSEYPWFKPLGWHDFGRIMQFYRDADICVTPSTWEEPFGLVAVEAMAIGRPCIVSDVGGLQEIVVPDETGFIFRRGNEEDLAKHLRTLLDDPGLRRRMGDAGRKRVDEMYDWKQVIHRHYPPLLEEVTR
jgi:glycosyltransferase involved in cell wall biosynthesis